MISLGQNLVVNGSFEYIDTCALDFGDVSIAEEWHNLYDTGESMADLFNECSDLDYLSVPDNIGGTQYATSGVGYSGFIPFGITEGILGTLRENLLRDSLYYVSFSISLADHSKNAVRNIGLVFLDSVVILNPDSFYTVVPDLVEFDWITDKVNWQRVDTVYKAGGYEEYLGIAYFPNENIHETIPVQGGVSNSTYYYVDDVTVIPYSVWLGVNDPKFNFSIYPNPATSNITIQSKTPLPQLWLSDMAGRVVLPTLRLRSGYANIDVSALPSGIYLVEAITEDGQRSVQKVVVE